MRPIMRGCGKSGNCSHLLSHGSNAPPAHDGLVIPIALPSPKQALLPELDQSRAGVRKRAIQCLASLAAALAPASLDDLCDTGGCCGACSGWRRVAVAC